MSLRTPGAGGRRTGRWHQRRRTRVLPPAARRPGKVEAPPREVVWSPPLSGPEVGTLVVVSCLLALVMRWPLVAHLGSHLPEIGLGDPYLQAWQVARVGYALRHQPLQFFQSNTFWPLPDSLAFSDTLIGYAPVGLIGSGADMAIVRYNLLFLLAYVTAFAGAFLLARELGTGPAAAAVAGAAYAYAPWRLAQDTHLHVITSGGIPIALFLLSRGYRRQQPRLVVAGWLVAAWQVSIGFTLGLQLAYLLALLGLIVALLWLHRGRTPIDRGLARATLLGGGMFVAWAAIQARPYLRVAETFTEARRAMVEVEFFSPPLRGLLAAPEQSFLWGGLTEPIRTTLSWPSEQALYPGVVALLLAGVGAITGVYPPAVRRGLAVAVVVTVLMSLGFGMTGGEYMYGLLYEFAPGWDGIRTPGRLMTLATLGLGLLAAAGAEWCAGRVARLGGRRAGRMVMAVAPLMLTGAVLLDGAGQTVLTPVRPPPPEQRDLPEPLYHLPSDIVHDLYHVYWSVEGFPRIVNGYSGFVPRTLETLRLETRGFPDEASVARLRSLGVRTVVLHRDLAKGSPWEDVAGRTVAGLPLRREDTGSLVIYHLAP